ncbi:MAG TPA: YraN family protein [Phycisphaerales bacterium]|nr:YraN family protein [Phycisphaerales bacterium]
MSGARLATGALAGLRRALGLAPARNARDGRTLGRNGERRAARFLRRAGYRVAGRNVRVVAGEADLVCVAPDRRTIVVVEVKTRMVPEGARGAPPPEASVHARKRRKLLAVARCLAARPAWRGRPVRIDVVAVDWPPTGPPVIRHYVDAVRG